MSEDNLNNMVRGWFVGDFDPSVFRTKACEVGVKHYKKGDCEPEHYHKVATEITLIQSGSARMLGTVYRSGAIVVIRPNQATAFEALEDCVTVVVKVPSVVNDKYWVEAPLISNGQNQS